MGFSSSSTSSTAAPPHQQQQQHHHTHKIFLFCNYILLGAASSCIFLTLSLRLVPSLCGFSLILLHAVTISAAVCGCSVVSSGGKWFSTHMVGTVLAAIFQGATAVFVFTRTSDFLGFLKSYVREDDGAVILKMTGGLSVLIFCLEWVALTLAFFFKYYAYAERDAIVLGGGGGGGGGGCGMGILRRSCAKVQQDEDVKDWPWPFQV